MMRHSIMTEKIARRGARIVSDYTADFLGQVPVSDMAAAPVVVLRADDSMALVREWIEKHAEGSSHQGFPVVDDDDQVVGVVTRRDLLGSTGAGGSVRAQIKRPPVVVYDDSSLREAADHMIHEAVGRLPVVSRDDPRRVIGMLTRSDVMMAHKRRLEAERPGEPIYTRPRWARPRVER
jgi:CIC family chloride channel protein